MTQRELYTIGDLGSLTPLASGRLRAPAPLRRQAARRAAMMGIGATISGWTPPAGLNMQSAGAALQTAATTLQNYLDTNGIPPESTSDPQVTAFQQAWNADPLAGTSALDVDGGYGPNVQAALGALTGLAAPVNTGQTVVANTASAIPSFPWTTMALVGGGAVALYWLFFRKKHHTHTHRTNPRRKKRKNARKSTKSRKARR